MATLVASRVAAAIPLLVLVSFLTFGMAHVAPGSVSQRILGDGATAERIAELDRELGLDRPFLIQYGEWLGKATRGDLGTSYINNRSVAGSLQATVPVTLSLAAAGLLVAVISGLALGLVASIRSGGLVDRGITVVSSVMLAVPGFWIGMLLALHVGVRTGWLPAVGYTPLSMGVLPWLQSLALPAIALATASAGAIARQMRGAVSDVLGRDYIRTARTKGAGQTRILLRHAFPNAMIPVVTIIGFQAAVMLGGSLVIESVFALPGISTVAVRAVIASDMPVVLGVVMITAVAVMAVNLVVDILYGFFDRRVTVA